MKQKWPCWDNEEQLQTPLAALRMRFGIRVVRH